MEDIEYSNNESIENSLNNTIKRIISDLANLSFECLLRESPLSYTDYTNIEKSKEFLI